MYLRGTRLKTKKYLTVILAYSGTLLRELSHPEICVGQSHCAENFPSGNGPLQFWDFARIVVMVDALESVH